MEDKELWTEEQRRFAEQWANRPREAEMRRERFESTFVIVLLVVLAVAATALITYFATTVHMLRNGVGDDVQKKINAVQETIDYYFVDEYDEETMSQAAADGAAAAMVESIGDEWSYYITAEEMQAHDERLNNTYVGVGINIQDTDEGFRVLSPVEGGPAEQAGVLAGDILVEVDGQSVTELTLEETSAMVKGEEGTEVTLGFLRDGELVTLTMTRKGIISVVAHAEMLENNIGLVTIDNFDLYAAEQSMACVQQLLDQGAEALIFDVRFNPGGMSSEMVALLDEFLPEGDVFITVDYRGTKEVETSDAERLEIPLAVLVNEDSYSAAEFFAAALQEYEAADIVGSQTYGKGHFQTTLRMNDGSGINLSIGRYYTPKGRSLIGVGVTPDVVVDLSDEDYELLYYGTLAHEDDPQLQAAIELLSDKNS